MAVSKHLQLFPMGTDMKMMIDTVDLGQTHSSTVGSNKAKVGAAQCYARCMDCPNIWYVSQHLKNVFWVDHSFPYKKNNNIPIDREI